MFNESGRRPHATSEDKIRAVAYFGFVVWAVLFFVFPPVAYTDSLDVGTRAFWVGTAGLGALIAMLGAVLRLDLKMELPGLIFAGIGPLFYFAAQIYYITHPLPDTDPYARIALAAYSLLPLLLLLPRMYALYSESRRVKRLSLSKVGLSPAEEAQPGAFRISFTTKRGD